MKSAPILLAALLFALPQAVVAGDMEQQFATPPNAARLSCFWWWLNGNVTQEAITRDLEAMKEKGFGGAILIDAGGASQDGNHQVPHGPDFASSEWRALYRHALREAGRLKLELALNIQSGWNLGGPGVAPEDSAKLLCWTETAVRGPGPVTATLSSPPQRGLLREVAVLAVPERADPQTGCEVTASSAHRDYPARLAGDGDAKTFWVSDGTALSDGALAWIRLAFDQDRPISRLTLSGRPGYGPKTFEVFVTGSDGLRRKLADGRAGADGVWSTAIEPELTVRHVEIRVTDGHDPAPVSGKPRNVQVAELRVEGPGWRWPSSSPTKTIPRWEEKALYRAVAGANHDTSFLIPAKPATDGGPVTASADVIDLTRFVDAAGRLQWTAPAGAWRVYRFCYTVAPHARVSTCSEGWDGLAIDPLDAGAFQRYWDAVVEPLMADAKEVGGGALKYLHTDSWEIEPFNWTANLPAEFQRHCGYDLTPWLPVLAGRVLGGTEASERFLHDFRKTVAALISENHYGPFLSNAHRHGVQVRAESGGPHGVPIDAQHGLGMIDVPMSEFWANSWRHRVADTGRFFIKQPASAAHTYGKPLVAAESFTTIGPHWQETVWNNLKPNLDRAFCEGLNQTVWCLVTCSPREMGLPGQEMFPGTHFNPNVTWWRQSEGFLAYINRCQTMLRQGRFVADALFYYGDHAPNFAGLKTHNPARLPAGYDYDVATEHVLLTRLAVEHGRFVLPDGMNYGALVLPAHRTISLPVLRKLEAFARAGGVIVGPRPETSSGLLAWQADGDREARDLIQRLWPERIAHTAVTDWLNASGLRPDFSVPDGGPLDFIHRCDGGTDLYFVANPTGKEFHGAAVFRVTGKSPEWWDPVTGQTRPLPQSRATADGRTEVPLMLPAFGSGFVVFRKDRAASSSRAENFPASEPLLTIAGPWRVRFDPAWFYPDNGTDGNVMFEKLVDWTTRPEPAIRHFSGAAVYRTEFDLPVAVSADQKPRSLALGDVREMARITINGRELGVCWCPPWTVTIPSGTLVEKGNRLEIEVVNLWPNRLIGDATLPVEQRRTRTNITKFSDPKGDPHYTTLLPSGLLGPVRIQQQNGTE